jgi:hypothetical protein
LKRQEHRFLGTNLENFCDASLERTLVELYADYLPRISVFSRLYLQSLTQSLGNGPFLAAFHLAICIARDGKTLAWDLQFPFFDMKN